jgi:hypothetical protein
MDNYCFLEMCTITFLVMLCSSVGKIKISKMTVKDKLFFPIICDSITHDGFTISDGKYLRLYRKRLRSFFWLWHTLNPKHFGLCIVKTNFFYFLQYNGRKHMEPWLVLLSIYFVFIIDQMLLEALNLRLATNILPD